MGGDKNYESKDISKVHKNQYKLWKKIGLHIIFNIEHEILKKNTKYISQKFKQNFTLMTSENMK
jgi:hypothetical protein